MSTALKIQFHPFYALRVEHHYDFWGLHLVQMSLCVQTTHALTNIP